MVAQVMTAQIQPGRADDLIRAFQDSLALAVAERQGFQGLILLTDSQASRALLIGLWATEAGRAASEHDGAYWERLAPVGDLIAGTLACELYEVSLQVEMTAEGSIHMHGI